MMPPGAAVPVAACAYDQDEEHNRARAGLLPRTEQIARVQFEMH